MTRASASPKSGARSPFAGCAVFIVAVLVMLFLIGFSVWTLFRQFDEIARFTSDSPALVEVSTIGEDTAPLNRLAERIEDFRQRLTGGEDALLELSPDEINLAIAAYEPFSELRGTFRVVRADEGSLHVAISFPLNGKPRLTRKGEEGWITSDPRFLNATMIATPALLQREVVLRIDDLQVDNATVPREFIEQMSPYRIAERYLTDPALGPAMAKLTRVEVADGKLRFLRAAGETPAELITRAQVESAGTRLLLVFGVGASLFLLFAGTMIFIGLRAKKGP